MRSVLLGLLSLSLVVSTATAQAADEAGSDESAEAASGDTVDPASGDTVEAASGDTVEAALEASQDTGSDPEPTPKPRKRRRPGTFFLGELGAGALFGPDGGRMVGGVIGFGGKWRGFPARFYLIGEVEAVGDMNRQGYYEDGTPVQDELSMFALGLGLRMYIPLAGPLRLLTEATGGNVKLTAREVSTAGVYEESINRGYFAVGIGPQVRVLHHLSLGARFEAMWINYSGVSSASSLAIWEPAAASRTRVLGTATFHF
jgi:hypothetical protein